MPNLPDKLPHGAGDVQAKVNGAVVNQFMSGRNRLAPNASIESANYDPTAQIAFKLSGDGGLEMGQVWSRFGLNGGLRSTIYELTLQRYGGRLLDKVRQLCGFKNIGSGVTSLSGTLNGAGPTDGPLTEVMFQCDVKNVVFVAGQATVAFPGGAFANGVIFATANLSNGTAYINVEINSATTTTAVLGVAAWDTVANVAWAGAITISYIVLGW